MRRTCAAHGWRQRLSRWEESASRSSFRAEPIWFATVWGEMPSASATSLWERPWKRDRMKMSRRRFGRAAMAASTSRRSRLASSSS